MNIYEQIDKLYTSRSNKNSKPQWVSEIKAELQEIKKLLKDCKNSSAFKRKSRDYYNFVNLLRGKLKPNKSKNIYPEVLFNNRRIGMNLKGFLYDKETMKQLSAQEAFRVYEYFYSHKEQIDSLITVN